MNDKSDLTVWPWSLKEKPKFQELVTCICISRSIFEIIMRSLKYWLQFETGHGQWPNYSSRSNIGINFEHDQNSVAMALVWWMPLTAVVQQCQKGACDLDIENKAFTTMVIRLLDDCTCLFYYVFINIRGQLHRDHMHL